MCSKFYKRDLFIFSLHKNNQPMTQQSDDNNMARRRKVDDDDWDEVEDEKKLFEPSVMVQKKLVQSLDSLKMSFER
jgi:hypothetical protein